MISLHLFDLGERGGLPPGVDEREAARWLDAAELARFHAFLAGEPRREFLATRVLVKRVLAACGVVEPRLEAPEGRAPRVVGARLSVSWAHAGGGVAVAVHPGGAAVGVDLEPVRAPSAALREGALGAAERAAAALSSDEGFFRAWTAKEAYMKRAGEGLAIDPRQLHVDLGAGELTDLRDGTVHAVAWSRFGRFVVATM